MIKLSRISKSVLLASSAVIVLAAGGVSFALANQSSDTPKPQTHTSLSQQVTEPTAEQSATSADTSTQATTDPAPQETTPPAPTPDENKTKVMGEISAFAASKGMNEGMVYAQTNCFDHAIASSVGYSSYDNIHDSAKFPLLTKYLNGEVYFDGGGTCRVVNF
jgi:hypothetical protein